MNNCGEFIGNREGPVSVNAIYWLPGGQVTSGLLCLANSLEFMEYSINSLSSLDLAREVEPLYCPSNRIMHRMPIDLQQHKTHVNLLL